ncbi:MAG: N-formylglutamate amidohydrolase [Planctomycetota bacterium]|nr:N-formylglutamate amidohydrolase [Planctomycetota bacterium]
MTAKKAGSNMSAEAAAHPLLASDQARALLEYCAADLRVCPTAEAWENIASRLKESVRTKAAVRCFPNCLTAAASFYYGDVHKVGCIEEQIVWAVQYGVLDIADALFRSVPHAQWYLGSVNLHWMETIGGQVPRYNRAQRTQRREEVLHAKAKRDAKEPVPLILHIPHSHLAIPASLKREFVVRHKKLSTHLAASTDHFTDELFDSNLPNTQALIFPISRLAVDPERFERDALEPMAKRGLGVLYERGHDGNVIREPISGARREELLAAWYRPHHEWLTQSVDDALARAPRALVIDCHTFPDLPFAMDADQEVPRPDVCIGTAGIHTPAWLVRAATKWCKSQGWSVRVDAPYSGSMVPLKHNSKDRRVLSIMIEINRARYMELQGTKAVRRASFKKCKRFVAGLVAALRGAVARDNAVNNLKVRKRKST